MRISPINVAPSKISSKPSYLNRNGQVSQAKNMTFGYYGTPRGNAPLLTILGGIAGTIGAAALTAGASLLVEAIVVTAGAIGGAAAGDTLNDKLTGNSKDE